MSPTATQWRILDVLRTYGSVTPRTFRHPTLDGGDEIDRLAARINELRDQGYRIETVMEATASGKRYARYYLRGEPAADVAGAPPAPTNPGTDDEVTGGAPEAPADDRLFDPMAGTPFSPYDDVAA